MSKAELKAMSKDELRNAIKHCEKMLASGTLVSVEKKAFMNRLTRFTNELARR